MYRYLLLSLLAPLVLFAQDPKVGDGFGLDVPFGTKILDVGFRNKDRVNVSTVRPARHILLRWDKVKLPRETVAVELQYAVPKQRISEEFGLRSNGLVAGVEFGRYAWLKPDEKQILVEVGYFDYVFRVLCYGRDGEVLNYSQYRYARQRR